MRTRTGLIALALAAVMTASTAAPAHAEANPTQDEFALQMLYRHNPHREVHHAPPLEEDPALSRRATEAAERLARSGETSGKAAQKAAGKDVGINLAWTNGGVLDGGAIVEAWYSQAAAYDYDRPGYSTETGAFTQMVWAKSTRMGAGFAELPGGGFLAIALYAPRGNMTGAFPDNVLRP